MYICIRVIAIPILMTEISSSKLLIGLQPITDRVGVG
jgi:hypothetical protein